MNETCDMQPWLIFCFISHLERVKDIHQWTFFQNWSANGSLNVITASVLPFYRHDAVYLLIHHHSDHLIGPKAFFGKNQVNNSPATTTTETHRNTQKPGDHFIPQGKKAWHILKSLTHPQICNTWHTLLNFLSLLTVILSCCYFLGID